MARNEEKQLGRLNRVYLEKEREAYLKKNPRRPKLNTLSTAGDIQKWLPSIKRDIEFNVKQSMVSCYPDRTVQEHLKRTDQLKWEYRSFVRRLRELDPSIRETPWTDRPYAGHKREICESQVCDNDSDDTNSSPSESADTKKPKFGFKSLSTPILDTDNSYREVYGFVEAPLIVYNVNEDLQDQPLDFQNPNQKVNIHNEHSPNISQCNFDLKDKPLVFSRQNLSRLKIVHLDSQSRALDVRATDDVIARHLDLSFCPSQKDSSTGESCPTMKDSSTGESRPTMKQVEQDRSFCAESRSQIVLPSSNDTRSETSLYLPYSDSDSDGDSHG